MSKMVYRSDVDGLRKWGRQKARWTDKEREHMEEGGVEWDEFVIINGKWGTWRHFCCGHLGYPRIHVRQEIDRKFPVYI